MNVSKSILKILLVSSLLSGYQVFANQNVPSPQDREIERATREIAKPQPHPNHTPQKSKKEQKQELFDYAATLEKRDWDSLEKRRECFQEEEKKQFGRLFDDLFSGDIGASMLGLGKTMYHELIGNECKTKYPLTPKAQHYMDLLNVILVDKYRDEKNKRLQVH